MRKRTRRKHYTLVNCVTHAIEGARITDEALINDVRLRELTSIEALRTGSGGLNEWQSVVDMLNVCETMAQSGIGPEALEACQRAPSELMGAAARFEKTGRMLLSGLGLQAVRDVFEYHDLQRQSISRRQYAEAIEKTLKAIKHKHPGVVVMAESLEAACR